MKPVSRRMASALVVAAVGLGPVLAVAQVGNTVQLQASLAGSNEVPPTSSAGTGTLTGNFNKDTKVLSYTVSYSGMSGPVKAGHFHGPAASGANAAVVLPFVDGLDSPIKGTSALNATQAADLLAGKWYVNLHTAANPNGEIRGQVLLK